MHKVTQYILIFLIGISFFSCKDGEGNSLFNPKRVSPPSIEDRVALSNAENLGRSSWQQPAFIVSKLGDIKGKKIADIGAGTGYFTFHLAYLNSNVIAIDIDPLMLNYIDTYKKKLPEEFIDNIETRLADLDDPNLLPGEIDRALIINTIGYIENLGDYLATVKPSIMSGGKLVIVDYKQKDMDIPAVIEKIVGVSELSILLEEAGYTNITIDDETLKYQYVVTADVD